jgi:hypothetical protein
MGVRSGRNRWQIHLDGMEALFVHQGPERRWTLVSRAIFENCRKLLVCKFLL